MESVSESTKVHFELDSFVDESIMNSIKEQVLPHSDSIGMNEQE